MGKHIKEGLKEWKLDSAMDTVTQYAIIGFVMTRPLKDKDKPLSSSTKSSLKKISS
jgi:hypothetical protein